MEFLIIAMLGLTTLAVLSIASGIVQGHSRWSRAFEAIAKRYGGFFVSSRLTRPPAAMFSYKDSPCRIRCRRSGQRKRGRRTEMRIQWPHKSTRLEIVPNNSKYPTPRLRKLKKLAPILTGDDHFDAAFKLYASQNQPFRQLVSSGVRWQMHQLAALPEPTPTRVFIERGWLHINRESYVKDEQTLDDFVRFCLELFDQLALTLSTGIEFNDEVKVTDGYEMSCPICSSEIEGKMVLCVRCKTPHCLDCWQYNGKCGMYACNESRYAMVKN